jgi:hypothetical protein
MALYPRPSFYTPSYATCGVVQGAGMGVLLGCWVSSTQVVAATFTAAVQRMVMGSVVLGVVRMLGKIVSVAAVNAVLPPAPAKKKHRYEVDGPVKVRSRLFARARHAGAPRTV